MQNLWTVLYLQGKITDKTELIWNHVSRNCMALSHFSAFAPQLPICFEVSPQYNLHPRNMVNGKNLHDIHNYLMERTKVGLS